MVTLDSTPASLPAREHPRFTLPAPWPLAAPRLRRYALSQPILVMPPAGHGAQQVIKGIWQAFRSVGWVLGFLFQLYVLYVVAHGLLALQGLVRWRLYRVWVHRTRFALRELEVRGIQHLRSDTPS